MSCHQNICHVVSHIIIKHVIPSKCHNIKKYGKFIIIQKPHSPPLKFESTLKYFEKSHNKYFKALNICWCVLISYDKCLKGILKPFIVNLY